MAESLVDSYKTELISDRVWRTVTQVELATAGWVCWYNTTRLHEALGDVPPVEYERDALTPARGGGPGARAGGTSHGSPYGLAALDPAAPADTLLTVQSK